MCSGCSGNYEDPGWSEDDEAGSSGVPAQGWGSAFYDRLGEEQYEVVVSAESIIEIRKIPANARAMSGLDLPVETKAWNRARPAGKHSRWPSAKYYRTRQRARPRTEKMRVNPANHLFWIGLAGFSTAVLGLWLLLG